MYCYNCGKEIDSEAKYCKYCGTQIDKEEVQENIQNDINSKTNETVNNKNIIIGIIVVVCIVILYCIAFSPVKFDIPIMGVSVEATVSYDFAMQKAKFRIGAFGFDKDNVSPIDFINMKLNLINHTLWQMQAYINLINKVLYMMILLGCYVNLSMKPKNQKRALLKLKIGYLKEICSMQTALKTTENMAI